MKNFLSHEVLGRGLFNTSYSSASGSSEAWVSQMTNGEDGALVNQILLHASLFLSLLVGPLSSRCQFIFYIESFSSIILRNDNRQFHSELLR